MADSTNLLADRTESFVVASGSAAVSLAAAAALYFSGAGGEETFQMDSDGCAVVARWRECGMRAHDSPRVQDPPPRPSALR